MSAIVLVHAFGSSSRAWAPQVHGLSDHHLVRAVGLPGHGDAAGPFTLRGAVESVRAAIDEAGGRAHLVGISGGAVVALLTYLEHPAQASSLVLSGGSLARRDGSRCSGRSAGSPPSRF
jgi:3-oxoadipate enol-lactonase